MAPGLQKTAGKDDPVLDGTFTDLQSRRSRQSRMRPRAKWLGTKRIRLTSRQPQGTHREARSANVGRRFLRPMRHKI